MPRPPIACRRAVHSLNNTTPSYIWISDELLARTVQHFFRGGCHHQKRHGSNIPGPLEARKRSTKRRMTAQAHVPQEPLLPSFLTNFGASLFPRRSSPKPPWRYEPPSKPPPVKDSDASLITYYPSSISGDSDFPLGTIPADHQIAHISLEPQPATDPIISIDQEQTEVPTKRKGRTRAKNRKRNLKEKTERTQELENSLSVTTDPDPILADHLVQTALELPNTNIPQAPRLRALRSQNAMAYLMKKNTELGNSSSETTDPHPIPADHLVQTALELSNAKISQAPRLRALRFQNAMAYLMKKKTEVGNSSSVTTDPDTILADHRIAQMSLESQPPPYTNLATGHMIDQEEPREISQAQRLRALLFQNAVADLTKKKQEAGNSLSITTDNDTIPNLAKEKIRELGKVSSATTDHDASVEQLLWNPDIALPPVDVDSLHDDSSRTLYQAHWKKLIRSISTLGTSQEQKTLQESLHVLASLFSANESIYPLHTSRILDCLNQALSHIVDLATLGQLLALVPRSVLSTWIPDLSIPSLESEGLHDAHPNSIWAEVKAVSQVWAIHDRPGRVNWSFQALFRLIAVSELEVEPRLPDLKTYKALLQFGSILDTARHAHVLPITHRAKSVTYLMRERVQIIHQVAHQYSIDNTLRQSHSRRSIFYLYRYLISYDLPIGPLFTQAMVRIMLIRPMSENRFVSLPMKNLVCAIVAQVEGDTVAKQIDHDFFEWRGALIAHAKKISDDLGGYGPVHVNTMKMLGLLD